MSKTASKTAKRRFAVRRSQIHGRGVYALTDLEPDEFLLEYQGEVIPWETAHARYEERADGDGSLTYFFDRGDGTVIDGESNGNSARYINHGCEPNCEAIDVSGRIYIHALKGIRAGEELLLDYALAVDEPDDPQLRELYACACPAVHCRGTMLADGGAAS
jgi:SET domain-containing protein